MKRQIKYSVEELRKKLGSKTWQSFFTHDTQRICGVTYCCRYGIFLGRRNLAIMAQGRFVIIRPLEAELIANGVPRWDAEPILNPRASKHNGWDLRHVSYSTWKVFVTFLRQPVVQQEGLEPHEAERTASCASTAELR